MIDELDLLAQLGNDIDPMPAESRARVRDRLLTRAGTAGTAGSAHLPPEPDLRPAGRSRRRWRTGRLGLRLGVAGAAVGGVAVAAAVVLPGTASAAYDLDTGPGGTVKVQIHEFTQAKKLQADLRAAGVNAVVDYLPFGQECAQPRGSQVPNPHGTPGGGRVTSSLSGGGKGGASLELTGLALRPGQMLVIDASFDKNDPRKGSRLAMTVVQGPVAPCRPVAAPLPPPGASTGAGNGGSTATQSGPDSDGRATTEHRSGEHGTGSQSGDSGPALRSDGPSGSGPIVESHQG